MVGCEAKTQLLVEGLSAGLEVVRQRAAALPRRPRVYFEEWDEPQISSIRWVSELIVLAGGEDCFPSCPFSPSGAIGSWPSRWRCRGVHLTSSSGRGAGRSFSLRKWLRVQAGADSGGTGWLCAGDQVGDHSAAGAAALTEGVRAIQGVIEEWAGRAAGGTGARCD